VVVVKFGVHPVNIEVLQDENSCLVVFEVLADLFVLVDGTRDRLKWELYQAGKCVVFQVLSV
jgi:hypothetical protein